MNCRSAKNKIADIASVIDQHKPHIIFGTESWLNSNIESNEIFPNGYKIFRKDRPDDYHGGGVFRPGCEKRYYNNTSFGPGHQLRNYLDPMSASRQGNKITAIWIILSTKFFQR